MRKASVALFFQISFTHFCFLFLYTCLFQIQGSYNRGGNGSTPRRNYLIISWHRQGISWYLQTITNRSKH